VVLKDDVSGDPDPDVNSGTITVDRLRVKIRTANHGEDEEQQRGRITRRGSVMEIRHRGSAAEEEKRYQHRR
jgi:hypothetical protein